MNNINSNDDDDDDDDDPYKEFQLRPLSLLPEPTAIESGAPTLSGRLSNLRQELMQSQQRASLSPRSAAKQQPKRGFGGNDYDDDDDPNLVLPQDISFTMPADLMHSPSELEEDGPKAYARKFFFYFFYSICFVFPPAAFSHYFFFLP